MKPLLLTLAVILATCVPARAQQRGHVTAERAGVRERPDAHAVLIVSVPRDAELDVLATDGAWLRVRVRETGVEGFIPSLFVRLTAAGERASSPSTAAASADAPPNAPPNGPLPEQRPAPQVISNGNASTRTFLGRVFGGLWNANGTGVQAGGGFALSPFTNTAFEISADGSFMRLGGANAYGGSVNAAFNIVLPSQKFTPFAGGGVVVVHQPGTSFTYDVFGVPYEFEVGGSTSVALQLLGGVDLPLSDRHAFRGELRIQFLPGGASVAALAGLSF